MLEEDLRSPCTEEIAVFRAFARAVDAGQDGFVVLDTAPTGHTILLLDAAEAYHREVLAHPGRDARERCVNCCRGCATRRSPACSSSPWPRPRRCTRPNACKPTWRRAGIEPFAWVINQSLLASGTRHPLLRQRGAYELPFIRQVADRAQPRVALVPWLPEAPVGSAGLARLVA